MIYANPIPAAMASGAFYDAAGKDYYLSPAKLESDYADVRFERELRLFRKHCPRGAVLDVGCSSGAFLFQLNKRWPGDYEILGTDVSGPPLDYAESRGVPVVRGDFLQMDFAKTSAATLPEALRPVPLPGRSGRGVRRDHALGRDRASRRAETVSGKGPRAAQARRTLLRARPELQITGRAIARRQVSLRLRAALELFHRPNAHGVVRLRSSMSSKPGSRISIRSSSGRTGAAVGAKCRTPSAASY